MFEHIPSFMAQNLEKGKQEKAMLDSVQSAADKIEYDPISTRLEVASIANMRMAALSIVFTLCSILNDEQQDDEDDDLLPNELLDSLMLEAFDDDIDDVNENVKATLAAHIIDAFSSLGVEDSIIEDIFGIDLDVADTAIEEAVETVVENLPDDGEPLDEFINVFVFGFDIDEVEGTEEGYDAVMFDASRKKLNVGKSTIKKIKGHSVKYKAVKAVRNGKIVTVNKRVSGKIKLTPKQKQALKKARKRAMSSSAITRRSRSLAKGFRANIYNKY